MLKYEVLFQDGFFRIVRDSSGQPDSVYIQHEHTKAPTRKLPFSDGRWIYCWFNNVTNKNNARSDMRCSLCETLVPMEMQGMILLMRWER